MLRQFANEVEMDPDFGRGQVLNLEEKGKDGVGRGIGNVRRMMIPDGHWRDVIRRECCVILCLSALMTMV